METGTFSLKGYSSADNPVLYFNYFLETENVRHTACRCGTRSACSSPATTASGTC